MAKKRIFIAIPISEDVQKEILKWTKRYKKLPVRWLAGKNLHITLIPPWYTDNVETVIKKLKKVECPPFDIEFSKVSYGPDPKRPRLIWAEGTASESVVCLKDKLEKMLPEYKSTYKEWLMHMTIARFDPDTFSSFPVKKIDEKVIWQDNIKTFVLMESHLSREGADYEILETFHLYGK